VLYGASIPIQGRSPTRPGRRALRTCGRLKALGAFSVKDYKPAAARTAASGFIQAARGDEEIWCSPVLPARCLQQNLSMHPRRPHGHQSSTPFPWPRSTRTVVTPGSRAAARGTRRPSIVDYGGALLGRNYEYACFFSRVTSSPSVPRTERPPAGRGPATSSTPRARAAGHARAESLSFCYTTRLPGHNSARPQQTHDPRSGAPIQPLSQARKRALLKAVTIHVRSPFP